MNHTVNDHFQLLEEIFAKAFGGLPVAGMRWEGQKRKTKEIGSMSMPHTSRRLSYFFQNFQLPDFQESIAPVHKGSGRVCFSRLWQGKQRAHSPLCSLSLHLFPLREGWYCSGKDIFCSWPESMYSTSVESNSSYLLLSFLQVFFPSTVAASIGGRSGHS